MPSKYSHSRHAVKHHDSDVNFEFSHVIDSSKGHRGGVCLVNIVIPSTKPVVDAQAPVLFFRLGLGLGLGLGLAAGPDVMLG